MSEKSLYLHFKQNQIIVNEKTPQQNDINKKVTPRPLWLSLMIHALIIIGVGLLLVFLLSIWLNHWTRHDDVVYVPDVKGMSFDEAQIHLLSQGFEVELSDSIYDNKAKRGAVVDQNPKDSTTVRSGRTIYLTINAFYPRMVYIPALTDISIRQARAALEGIGIKNITIKEVPSLYKDLVLGAKWNGKQLMPGTRVPLNAKIVLEVGIGTEQEESIAATPDSQSTTSVETSNNNTSVSGELDFFD